MTRQPGGQGTERPIGLSKTPVLRAAKVVALGAKERIMIIGYSSLGRGLCGPGVAPLKIARAAVPTEPGASRYRPAGWRLD